MDHLIIVAAGSGTRYGGDLPKQFQPLDGRPLLMTTVERLHQAYPRARVWLVLSPAMTGFWQHECVLHGFLVPHTVVPGGDCRARSVLHAVTALAGEDAEARGWTAVHDGARPCLDPAMLSRLESAMESSPAAIPVVPVTDTLRHIDDGGGSHTVDRGLFRAVQTPQFFHTALLRRAYLEGFDPLATDDATLVQQVTGTAPALVQGDPGNIKVTNPGDIEKISRTARANPGI